MSERRAIELGEKAAAILDSEAWQVAWDAYHQRLHELIDEAASHDTETVMHLKRLIASARAVRGHLEMLVKHGTVSVAQIEFDRKKGLRKIFG